MKIKLIISFTFLVAAIGAFSEDCLAQDRSDNFFEKDSANSPLKVQEPMPGFESSAPKVKKKPDPVKSVKKEAPKKPSSDFANIDEKPELMADAKLDDDNTDVFGEGVEIKWIGVILNTDDKDHTDNNLSELSALASNYDWTVGPIFAVGHADRIDSWELINKLAVRGAVLDPRYEIPGKYKAVKLSPTWIVQTEKGQVLLEALGSLKKNINQQGQLVVKKGLGL